MGERLRAIVVTDFERAGHAVARVGEALVADAGSARHTFRTLISHPPLRDLDPVLITGSTLWVVVKGVAHVDPDLAWQLLTRPWKQVRYERDNRRAIGDRDGSSELDFKPQAPFLMAG